MFITAWALTRRWTPIHGTTTEMWFWRQGWRGAGVLSCRRRNPDLICDLRLSSHLQGGRNRSQTPAEWRAEHLEKVITPPPLLKYNQPRCSRADRRASCDLCQPFAPPWSESLAHHSSVGRKGGNLCCLHFCYLDVATLSSLTKAKISSAHCVAFASHDVWKPLNQSQKWVTVLGWRSGCKFAWN